MILLGLDPRSTATLAVFVSGEGDILSRRVEAASDPAAIAAAATHDGARPHATGGVLRSHPSGSRPGAEPPPLPHASDNSADITWVNPGAAIALAEQWTGAAKGARHVVALSVGASVHAGVVVDGRLVTGAHGLAGAAGWLALNPVEREDYRKLGGLEAEVGANGIVRRLVWRIKAGDESSVVDAAGGLSNVTVRHVLDAARAGDGVAISVVRDTAKYIGMAAANFVAVLDPEIVVLGGSLAEAGDLLLDPIRAELARRVPPSAAAGIPVAPARLGEEAAAVGAARAALLGLAGREEAATAR